jgi:hypothetical protein
LAAGTDGGAVVIGAWLRTDAQAATRRLTTIPAAIRDSEEL